MPLIVHSPFSGRPIKVRNQDVGRAVRDDEGRIFYPIARSDGQGYYGARTRHGSAQDERHYFELLANHTSVAESQTRSNVETVHDATGRPQRRPRRWVIVLLLILIAATAGYGYWAVMRSNLLSRFRPQDAAAPQPTRSTKVQTREEAHISISTPASTNSPIAHGRPRARVFGHQGAAPERESAHATNAPPNRPPVGADHAVAISPPTTAFTATGSGLLYHVDEPGFGMTATMGSFVIIDYVAMLANGTIIDTTQQTGPIGFVLWSGQVIRGWDEGVAGMRVGEKRTLILPPNLVHGDDAANHPGDVLHTVIRLRDVRPGLAIKVEQPGAGPLARPGDTVRLHYTAYVAGQDQPFDSSHRRDRPFEFCIGAGAVIAGWELGVTGMAEGERRTIEIPSYLAYGKRGFGTLIPPHATLRYEIDLLRVY